MSGCKTSHVRLVILTLLLASVAMPSAAQDVNEPVTSRVTLPENPCYLLTIQQVAKATGLEVAEARLAPGLATTCSFQTRGDFGPINITLPARADRGTATYKQNRDAYFSQNAGSAQKVPGQGFDSYLAGGKTHHVRRRRTSTQHRYAGAPPRRKRWSSASQKRSCGR
jgi:hypothetical protein